MAAKTQQQESFVIWEEVESMDCEIRYLSRGFRELFKITSEADVNKTQPPWKCVTQLAPLDASLQPLHLDHSQLDRKLKYFEAYLLLEHRTITTGKPGEKVGCAWMLNATCSGELFVCEHIILSFQHPSFQWSQNTGVSFQRDISAEITVNDFVNLAETGAYMKLMQVRRNQIKKELTKDFIHARVMPELESRTRRLPGKLVSAAPATASDEVPPAGPGPKASDWRTEPCVCDVA